MRIDAHRVLSRWMTYIARMQGCTIINQRRHVGLQKLAALSQIASSSLGPHKSYKFVQDDSSVKLQLQATSVGEVVIKGICANRYLAMNRDGRLFGARRATDECYFLERLESNNYNTYSSRKYPNMYVALKRTGQYKSGSKTGPGQKAILFLPMSAKY
ncbi:fibroblast growth factor 2 isoform X1 [Synchiropus splendidus]|uniref:fibroblast growth factor 2 isoform X1 n=1 Tax=Synchiropus splendidus TaxID=270530 RepID=UPI00237ED78F|nr:fibroblast growth factor 2 isoform X1 [Synchiropus splendidus]